MNKKPKILLIPNVPRWAFDNKADQIIKRFSHKYSFNKIYHRDLHSKKMDFEQYDCIFVFYWPAIQVLRNKISEPELKKRLVTGIFSYNSWEGRKKLLKKQLDLCRAVIIPNKEMKNIFASNSKFKVFYIPQLVDEKMFFPKEVKKQTDKLIVGWAGNPNHCGPNYKGYWNIVLPVCQKNSNWIELKTALQGKRFIPYPKMNKFYNSIDVITCLSKNETGPNTIIEAGACKKAAVSTNVGLVKEIINKNNGIVIKRSRSELERALRRLHDDRKLLKKLSNNLYKTVINKRTFSKKIKEYQKMFDLVINQK